MGTIRHGAEVSLYDFGPTPLFAFEQAALALSAAVTAPALVKTRKAVIEAFGWPSQGSDSMKRNAIRCVDGLASLPHLHQRRGVPGSVLAVDQPVVGPAHHTSL